jgi:hypothetical protein
VGSQAEPLDRDWRLVDDHLLRSVWFSKYPRSVRGGDLFVYYAARWRCFPALMELVSDEVVDDADGHPVDGKRWRWRMEVRPLVTLELRSAPALEQTSIDPLRLRRQSHILLTEREYDELRSLVLAAAEREAQLDNA